MVNITKFDKEGELFHNHKQTNKQANALEEAKQQLTWLGTI